MTDLTPEPTFTINPDRLAKLLAGEVKLDEGSHFDFDEGHCAMEVVSWLAELGFTDTPSCSSHVLGNAFIAFNDNASDTDRQRLVPLLPRTVGTRDDGLDVQRKFVGADHLVRIGVPLVLDHTGFTEQAALLRELAPIDDDDSMTAAFAQLRDVLESIEAPVFGPDFDREAAYAIGHRAVFDGGLNVMVALGMYSNWDLHAKMATVLQQRVMPTHIHNLEPTLQGPRWEGQGFDYAAYRAETEQKFLDDLRGKLLDAALDMLTAAIKPGVEAPTPTTEGTK